MDSEEDEGNEPLPEWSCNPDSMRRKPHSVSDIKSHNAAHKGIVRI